MADTSNTGRNFLLIGAVLGIGAAAVGAWLLSAEQPEPLNTDVSQTTGENGSEDLTKTAEEQRTNAFTQRRLVDVAPPQEEAYVPRRNAGGGRIPRYTPLFFSPLIWQVADDAAKKNIAVDLLAEDSKPVHKLPAIGDRKEQSVPNSWFFSYGLDSLLGTGSALSTDSDGDGFTNGEEFVAKTDPNDRASLPPFLSSDGAAKVVLTGDKTFLSHYMELSTASGFDEQSANINIYAEDGRTRKKQFRELRAGATFGFGDADSGPLMRNRFTLVSFARREKDGMQSYCVHVKDSYAAADGAGEFDLSAGSRDRRRVRDAGVKLRMTAGPKKGQEFFIREGEKVDVPGFPKATIRLEDAGRKKGPAKVSIDDTDPIEISAETAQQPQ